MKYKDPKPEVLRVEELVIGVKTGDIKLPKFQRPFVWNKQDILRLWDSIYKGYPVGSILLWFTKEKLASERKIGDLEINERAEEYPTNYLLDGQQRLSSLCGPLFWDQKDKNSYWSIVFDVEQEEFLYPEEPKITHFPICKILDTSDFLQQCRVFEASDRKKDYILKAERLLQAIKNYKIAAVTIGDMSLDEVAPIFERINSSGRQLTIVDLMRAATWKQGGFDLSDAIDTVRKSCEAKNFFNIDETHILRSISACTGLGIHKEAIDKLRDKTSEQLKLAADKSIEAYKLAVDFLTTELPLSSISYLPYALQLTYLVEFFNICPRPSAHQRKELQTWFWKTSFTKHYGVANTALINKDLSLVRSFANGEAPKIPVEKKIGLKGFTQDSFALNKASSATFALLLARRKPKSLLDGSAIDTYKALSIANKLEYHHIFPKAYLKNDGYSKHSINYHANICMLNLSNNREISDKKPSRYFKEIAEKLGDKLEAVLESNFIDEKAYQACLEDDYDSFIQHRQEKIFADIISLVDDEVL